MEPDKWVASGSAYGLTVEAAYIGVKREVSIEDLEEGNPIKKVLTLDLSPQDLAQLFDAALDAELISISIQPRPLP